MYNHDQMIFEWTHEGEWTSMRPFLNVPVQQNETLKAIHHELFLYHLFVKMHKMYWFCLQLPCVLLLWLSSMCPCGSSYDTLVFKCWVWRGFTWYSYIFSAGPSFIDSPVRTSLRVISKRDLPSISCGGKYISCVWVHLEKLHVILM